MERFVQALYREPEAQLLQQFSLVRMSRTVVEWLAYVDSVIIYVLSGPIKSRSAMYYPHTFSLLEDQLPHKYQYQSCSM